MDALRTIPASTTACPNPRHEQPREKRSSVLVQLSETHPQRSRAPTRPDTGPLLLAFETLPYRTRCTVTLYNISSCAIKLCFGQQIRTPGRCNRNGGFRHQRSRWLRLQPGGGGVQRSSDADERSEDDPVLPATEAVRVQVSFNHATTLFSRSIELGI